MAATKLQMNWTAVGFTPSGGSLTAITKITNVAVDYGGQLLPFAGDNDRYPTTVVNNMNSPTITVTSGDFAVLAGFAPGTVGVLTATHKDAKGATNGDIVYTMANAVVSAPQGGGAFSQYGSGSLAWQSYSSDGATSPLGFTRV